MAIDYEIKRYDETGDIMECYSCSQQVPLHSFDAPSFRSEGPYEFCAICASTMAGNAHQYPGQYPDEAACSTIAAVGNMILVEIRELRAEVARLRGEGDGSAPS